MKRHFPYRETIFGLEDSIVSTLGVVVGMAAGTNDRYIVILSAMVIIIVESLSMTAGTFLSNKSDLEIRHQSVNHLNRNPLIDSFYMGIFYIIGGIISILPFVFFSPLNAIVPAIILSALTLFIIGAVKGRVAKINILQSGLEMSLVSLFAAGVSYLVGWLASQFLHLPL